MSTLVKDFTKLTLVAPAPQMMARKVWTQITTADLENLGPLSAALKQAQTAGRQDLRPIPLFVRDHVQYYLDLSHGDQWPEQDAGAQAVAGVRVFDIEDQHCEFEHSLVRSGGNAESGLIKSGLVLGCLMHHERLSRAPRTDFPSMGQLQSTGFFVLVDSMDRSLWLTAAECGVYGEEQEQGLRRLSPGEDDDDDVCESSGKINDEYMLWGRAFPDCKKRYPRLNDLHGTVKISNGAWWKEPIDERRKASGLTGKSYKCRVEGQG